MLGLRPSSSWASSYCFGGGAFRLHRVSGGFEGLGPGFEM